MTQEAVIHWRSACMFLPLQFEEVLVAVRGPGKLHHHRWIEIGWYVPGDHLHAESHKLDCFATHGMSGSYGIEGTSEDRDWGGVVYAWAPLPLVPAIERPEEKPA